MAPTPLEKQRPLAPPPPPPRQRISPEKYCIPPPPPPPPPPRQRIPPENSCISPPPPRHVSRESSLISTSTRSSLKTNFASVEGSNHALVIPEGGSTIASDMSYDTMSSNETKKKEERIKNRMLLKRLSTFSSIKIAQLLCVIYILVLTFSKVPIGLVDPESGTIIDVNSEENTEKGVILVNGDCRPIVAETTFQMLCLAISRMSAFSMYPVLMAVFISKCKALLSFLDGTPMSMYMIQDSHKVHSYAGKYIAFDVWIHTIFHLLRWGSQGNISLLWKSRTGLSGLIVVVVTPLITFPMIYWKKSIPYEIRKGLHYLFYVFAIGMCFHVPVTAIPNGGFIAPILGFCILLYTLDTLYVCFFATEKIETTTFQVLPSGVQMSMVVSSAFQKRREQGGFAYVCLPWVDRSQWHAFSLFENPNMANKREVFMQNAGNWTQDVHKALQRNTVRPVWIQGPFASPYKNAESYDNQILVATGIGITPALSVIRAHKQSRRINLIWSVRDASMLEFFLERLYLDHDGWNLIFYTGKSPLNPVLEELNSNVKVLKYRPDLHVVIPNIIYGVESGKGLPEKYVPREIARANELLIKRTRELDSTPEMTTREKLKDLTALAHSRGFLFTELVNNLTFEDEEKPEDTSCFESDESNSRRNQMVTSESKTAIECSPEGSIYTPNTKTGRKFLQQIRLFDNAQEYPIQMVPCTSKVNNSSSLDSRRCSISGVLTTAFKPWKKHEMAKEFVNKLDTELILSTWGILYCGGNKNVENDLKHISEEYCLALNVEAFDW